MLVSHSQSSPSSTSLRQALAGSRHAGLVSAWSHQFREGDAPDPISARREVQGRLDHPVVLIGIEGQAMSPERREESAVGSECPMAQYLYASHINYTPYFHSSQGRQRFSV